MSPFNASIRGTFGVEGRFNGGGAWPPNSAAASYADFSATTTSWTAPAGVWRVNVVAVGGGGWGAYQGGWTTAGAGAGGYNGKGGQYNSLPDGQYQGFGGAGGSGGTQYSSTYGGVGGGGGVGINGQGTGVGTGNDGGHFGYNPWYGWGGNYGGIGGESTTDAPNSYGCNGENQWSNNWPCGGNNIYGAAYGGGGGGSGTSQGGGRGGDGGLRITWNTSGKSIRTRGNTGN